MIFFFFSEGEKGNSVLDFSRGSPVMQAEGIGGGKFLISAIQQDAGNFFATISPGKIQHTVLVHECRRITKQPYCD
jgi:hypothetical protein